MRSVEPSDAIVVDALVKDYGRGSAHKRALDAVSLRVVRGSAYGLIGPNGAGKTTLLKTLLGVVRASSGSVRVLGREPGDVHVLARLGYMPERRHLPESWTALAYLHSIGRLRRVADLETCSARELGRVGLAAEGRARIGTFSKGMRQRLAFAAALLGAPELLVLDEPTDGVDPKGRADIRAILKEELARGATVLLNSHLLSETERICDHVGILIGGHLACTGPVAEVCPSGDLEALLFAKMEQLGA